MNRQELKQFIRHVFDETSDSVTRGYVVLDPANGNLNYLSMGARRPAGYALKQLLPVLWKGLTLVGAFAISESRPGGTLSYRTECRIISATTASPTILSVIEQAVRAYAEKKVDDRVVRVAGRSWDDPRRLVP